MNSEYERLLSEVMAEGREDGLGTAILGGTVRHARRRRRLRQGRRVVAVMAALGLLASVVWKTAPHGGRAIANWNSRRAPVPAIGLVPATVVVTVGFAGDRVATVAGARVVETPAQGGRYRVIGDDELLSLAVPNFAALVRLDSGTERFFYNPGNAASSAVPLN